jgi:hypothetical protein
MHGFATPNNLPDTHRKQGAQNLNLPFAKASGQINNNLEFTI